MAGRGFGKTRTGAEWVRFRIQNWSLTRTHRITLAGPTAADVRDIMVLGESGLLAVLDRVGIKYRYVKSERTIHIPEYNAEILLISADEPDRFRGLQHDTVWADEIAAWRYGPYAVQQIRFGLRLPGGQPRMCATTTPRPTEFMRKLLARKATAITKGTTYENLENLDDEFREEILSEYEGTTVGRQEIEGELIDDIPGALWTRALLDKTRVSFDQVPDIAHMVAAVDPATTYGEGADATGLAGVGRGVDGHIYVFSAIGLHVKPAAWGRAALAIYDTLEADLIVAESNQGGEMVRDTINAAATKRDLKPRIKLIHASRGKKVRADPVQALYEQGLVHHVGMLKELEDQMCEFPVSDGLDDIVDALVHGVMECRTRRRGKARSH